MDKSVSTTQEWVICPEPEINDILRWHEPIWAMPSKPRGKRHKIGEQAITAQLTNIQDFMQFTVINVEKVGTDQVSLNVKENDIIRRKESTLEQGNCYRLQDIEA